MPAKGWKKAPDGTWAPPNQMRHTLEIEEDTQVFLEEMMDKYLQGKAIRAAGEAAEGFLSNPASALWVGGGILAVVATVVGAEKLESITDYFASLQTLLNAKEGEEQREAANGLIISLRSLIRGLSPLGPFTPLP